MWPVQISNPPHPTPHFHESIKAYETFTSAQPEPV